MGEIRIDVHGSFATTRARMTRSRTFEATTFGYAAALGEAIAYLTSLLPPAIELDHALQAEGARPTKGFGLPEESTEENQG
jgi:hypothetical protein